SKSEPLGWASVRQCHPRPGSEFGGEIGYIAFYCLPVETTSMTAAPCATLAPAAGVCMYTTPRGFDVEAWRVTWARSPVAVSFCTASASRSPTTNGTTRNEGGATVTVTVVVCPPQADARIVSANASATTQ